MNDTKWSQRDDSSLMQGVAAGDELALRCLIERFAPTVIAICRRILGNGADAEDVAAELFAELWYKRGRFDNSRGTPQAYIRLLARSRCFDRLKKQDSTFLINEQLLNELLVDAENSPFKSAELSDLSRTLKRELAALAPEQQEAIELAFFHGLTHQETAVRMDMPLGTAKTHIRKGLAKLRFLLRRDRNE